MSTEKTTIRLAVKRGEITDKTLDLAEQDIQIGRNPDAHLSFDDESNEGVSWDHATIHLEGSGAFVADVGSTNGTYVNGIKVEGRVPLHEHDVVQLGTRGPEIEILKISLPTATAAEARQPSDRESSSTPPPAKPQRHRAAAAVASDAAHEDTPSKAPKDRERKSEATPDVRFGDYVVRHFGQTKGAFAFGICLAILAAPVLSLFRARLQLVGVWAALGLLAAFCFACGFAYLVGRWLSFYLLRRRSVGENARSLTAKAFYTTAIATILLFPIPIIESFSSEQGMLVTLLPQLEGLQRKPNLEPVPPPIKPDSPPAPVPPSSEPNPTAADPVPPSSEPNPTAADPVPPPSEPNPTAADPVPPPSEPNPTAPDPVPPPSEPKPTPSDPGPSETKPTVPSAYLAEDAHFVLVNPQHCAVGIRQDDKTQFRNVYETTDDGLPLPAQAQSLQRIGLDPSLTRQIFDRTDPGQLVPQDLSTRIGMYWRPQRFLPQDVSDAAEFVAFKDLEQDKYLLGLLSNTKDDQLSLFTLQDRSLHRDRKVIVPGTAVRGPGRDFAATVAEADFLDYALLNVIKHLHAKDERPGYSLLAVRVDTRRIQEQVEELAKSESQSMDNLQKMKSIVAGPPGSSRYIGGRGILGVILAFSYMNAERRAENALTSPFLQELQSARSVREAASHLLQFLQEQANWVEDDIYRILTQHKITVLDRARLDEVLEEQRRSTRDDFKPAELASLFTATHLLSVELGRAREGGTYHVTATLRECSSGGQVWSDHRDRSLVANPSPFLRNTGPLAKLCTPAEATKIKLVHIDRHDPAALLRYREVFGSDTRELRGAAASFGYIDGDADVPPPLVSKYLAWRIASATMPVASSVKSARQSVGTIWVADSRSVKVGDKLTVYRDATRSIQRPLATPATVTKIGQNEAEIQVTAPGVKYVWPDECSLMEGDLVVPVGRQQPLVATFGFELISPNLPVRQNLGINNALQLNRAVVELTNTMKAISDDIKRELLDAGVEIIAVEGGNPATRTQDARQRGATHVVMGSYSLTRERSQYELEMGLFPIDDEGNKTLVKLTVK